jgi:hypothetical protein
MKYFIAFTGMLFFITGIGISQNKTVDSLERVYKAAKTDHNYKLAFTAYGSYIAARDTFNKETARSANLKKRLKYEYGKKVTTDSIIHARETELKDIALQKQEAELNVKRSLQYALYTGLLLVILFAAYMYNRFKVAYRQKKIIEQKEQLAQSQNEIIMIQKNSVEEKQNEILSSIAYARRIQRSLMPNDNYIEKKLEELKRIR